MGTVGSTDWQRATALLDEVDRDPESVARTAVEMATDAAHAADPAVVSIAWRAAGIGLRMLGRITEALGAFDESVAAAERAGDVRLAGLARTSRAAPRFISGDMSGGLADLDRALADLDGADRGVALFQRAQYLDVVEDPGATAAFDAAIELLGDSPAHAKYLGHALANRGVHHSVYRRFDDARRDLTDALSIWDRLGLDALAATVVHNLGVVAMFSGEFVEALDHFGTAQQRSSTLGNEQAASGRDYCDALLAVGLAAEARDRAVELARASSAIGDGLAAAELQLLGAHAALQVGDPATTEELAAAALAWFERAGRPGWAAQARLALARTAIERGTAEIGELDRLAGDLTRRGWHDAALHAGLLAAEVAAGRARAGDREQLADGRARLDALGPRVRAARAERRLHAVTVDAQLAVAGHEPAAARRAVRRGLAIVEQEQRSVGAIDARAHFASHATDLLRIGRTVAVGQRDARAAWRDLERTRALSLRRPRVRPVDDHVLGGLLAQLRQVSVDLALDEPGSPSWQALGRSQQRLQREIADHVRRTPGAGDDAPEADIDDVVELLRGSGGSRHDGRGGAMVSFDVVDGRLWTFVLDGRMRRIDAGPAADVVDRVAAAALAVRRLARRTTSAHSVSVGLAQLTDLVAWLDERLPLPRSAGPLALVVPSELAAVPWGALPSLRARPLTLAPSVWSWAQSMRRPADPAGRATFLAGPGLPMAAAEVEQAAATHPDAAVLTGDLAVAHLAAEAVERSTLAHVAAHYAPRRGNALFSAFELADGPWFLHDLIRCASMPSIWVVPSCESSVGEAPVAGELLGLSSVLLGAGVRSVVMSSGLVPDDPATVATMTALHRGLAAGEGAAVALAEALDAAGDTPAAIVLRSTLACHGAW